MLQIQPERSKGSDISHAWGLSSHWLTELQSPHIYTHVHIKYPQTHEHDQHDHVHTSNETQTII